MHEAPQKPETPDYYADLGIAEDATTTEIKKAYRGLALLYHPDKKAPGKKIDAVDFRRVNEAYEVLGDLEERKIYDEGHWYIRTQWTAYQRQFDEWEAQQEAERLRKAAEEEGRRRAIEMLERLRAKEEAERRRAEDAKRQRWQDECDNARRYSMADWAYRQAQRLKEEARQREEDDRGQREREEVLSRKKDAERAEQKAEEQREKVREWARKQAEKEEEQQRQQRRAERARKRRARGLPPCLDSLDCSCKTCFYEYYWQRYKRDHAYANAFDEGDMWERMEEAERASEEAAQRAATENDRKARERLEKIEEAEKKKKERDQKALERKQAARARCAERSTQAAAQKQRAEQEKMAKLRMANQHIQEQQDNYLAGCGEDAISTEKVVIDIGWKKVKGAAMCLLCEDEINYYSFRCPDGGAIACNPCKNRMCHFTLPKISKASDDEDLVEPGAAQ